MSADLKINAPRNRGRFSDRRAWDAVHRDRLERWRDGQSVDAIAALHGVKRRTVHYSIRRCLDSMPRDAAASAVKQRWHGRLNRLRIIRRLLHLDEERLRLELLLHWSYFDGDSGFKSMPAQ